MVFNYVVGFCSIIALYITYRSTKREKTRKLHCHSSLDLEDGARAIIKIVNVGAPNITIENIALSLVIWEDKPWFPLKGWSFIGQIVNKIWNYQHDQVYISQSKILNPMTTKYPATLTDSQYITVSIDLIETTDIFKRKCNFVDRPNYLWRMFYGLTIDVVCSHKTYKLKPSREIWQYMISQYRILFQ